MAASAKAGSGPNGYASHSAYRGSQTRIDKADIRGQLIRYLEDALALADEIGDGRTGYLTERALDENAIAAI